ncbi:Nucleoside-diphosphate-sugar epimerase [Pseudoxanthobacter soli DSM 19599]|uniref:Nucleoside-diphosphate-sugar epimerase n=1 Tax=Pseudoxanthobacter soli DSM 19599 TaxID=1123029 RepID=A0A1M7ZMJ0_9HYPH|nr:SDR family oxidoreductase [Pseudoxanthobacter soli]SHO66029.1 Nucleoside-diphosphate-sugar epimerase [Pseudoxanthobacter soli DSM 19599]
MRVFVTGATGFVGSAIVRELIGAGHEVRGLARSEAGARALAETGAAVHRGDLQDLESLRQGAAGMDAVIHTAFIHDFSRFKENCEVDRRVIGALADALGSGRPLIVTSGTGLLPSGRLATEDDEVPASAAIPRIASEQAAAEASARGVDVRVVRLPPSVHGDGDHGFVPLLIGLAREKGLSAYIGEGGNVWPAVHRFDAARLYRLVLEKGTAGARFHGVAEDGVPFRRIAEVIGRRLNLPVMSLSGEDVAAHFGWFAHFAGIDNRATGHKTRDALSWRPEEAGLIEDLDRPAYFAT